jgi:hypothetical protein
MNQGTLGRRSQPWSHEQPVQDSQRCHPRKANPLFQPKSALGWGLCLESVPVAHIYCTGSTTMPHCAKAEGAQLPQMLLKYCCQVIAAFCHLHDAPCMRSFPERHNLSQSVAAAAVVLGAPGGARATCRSRPRCTITLCTITGIL